MDVRSDNGMSAAERCIGAETPMHGNGIVVAPGGQSTDSAGPARRRRNRGVGASKGQPAASNGRHPDPVVPSGIAAAALRANATEGFSDHVAAGRWPALYATLNAVRDLNGDVCEPGGLSINVRAGRLSFSLRSPAYNTRVSGFASALGTLLDDVEALLNGSDPVCVPLKRHVAEKFRKRGGKELTNPPS